MSGCLLNDLKKDVDILLLDDDAGFVDSIQSLLHLEGYPCFGTTKFEEIIDYVEAAKGKPQILIVDYLMVGITAFIVIEKIREIAPDTYIILLTGFAQNMPGVYAMKNLDIDAYCIKSADIDNLLVQIEMALKSVRKGCHASLERQDELEFHERIRRLRIERNLTQEEIGSYIGVGRTTIVNYEQGRIRPTLENVMKLSKLFGVSCDYLLSESNGINESTCIK